MTLLLVVAGALLQLVGLVGCILPVLPGPPLNWLGLLLVWLAREGEPFSGMFLAVWAAVALGVTVLDYIVPAWGARRAGASRHGVVGSVVGMVVGIVWFPPFGMLVGALVGAILGEMIAGRATGASLKAGAGVFLGTTLGILLKLTASAVMTYYFVIAAF